MTSKVFIVLLLVSVVMAADERIVTLASNAQLSDLTPFELAKAIA